MKHSHDIEDVCSRLIKLADEMSRGEGMPSACLEDWDLTEMKLTPATVRQEIIGQSLAAQNKARQWAMGLRTAVELLKAKQ